MARPSPGAEADRGHGAAAAAVRSMDTKMGRVEALWIKRAHRGPMDAVARVELVKNQGIVGNANQGRFRQVTIISVESWAEACAELGATLDPALRRANVLVSGLDLSWSRGRTLVIGTSTLRIWGQTRPCARMDEAHPGLMKVLSTPWRGGAFGVVMEGGEIDVGASAEWTGERTV